jgi:prophage regulatory protein
MTSPSDNLMRISEVATWLNVSKTTIYKWVREDRFPPPIILGDHASRWLESDIAAWLTERPRGVQDDS